MHAKHYLTVYRRGEFIACLPIASADRALPVFNAIITTKQRIRAVIECEASAQLTTIGTIHIGKSGRAQLRPAYNGRTVSV